MQQPLTRRLLELTHERAAFQHGDFTLASGRQTRYYFDGRLLSLDPEGAWLIGQAMLPIVQAAGATHVAGPTLGADPIVTAIAIASHLEAQQTGSPRIAAAIVRKEPKTHGAARQIEGCLSPRAQVAVVDDACSTGASLFHAIAAVEATGCTVVKVIALLDRSEGGGAELERRGYDFTALLTVNGSGQLEAKPPNADSADRP